MLWIIAVVNSQYARAPCMALGRSRARPMGRETLARVSESGLPDASKASGIFLAGRARQTKKALPFVFGVACG